MLMRKSRHRRRTPLWDLFQRPPRIPTWEELPLSVQDRIRDLLVRVLREHVKQKAANATVKEDGHE
jgi:hypothetical protein